MWLYAVLPGKTQPLWMLKLSGQRLSSLFLLYQRYLVGTSIARPRAAFRRPLRVLIGQVQKEKTTRFWLLALHCLRLVSWIDVSVRIRLFPGSFHRKNRLSKTSMPAPKWSRFIFSLSYLLNSVVIQQYHRLCLKSALSVQLRLSFSVLQLSAGGSVQW